MAVYANAAEVLPPELLQAVQKHWRGLLYIPPRKKTDKYFIIKQIISGMSVDEAAKTVGVTPRRIYQITQNGQSSQSPHVARQIRKRT